MLAVRERATLGFVPTPHRWLATPCAALDRSGMGFREAVPADGPLPVALLSDERTELVAVVGPRREGVPGFASTRRFPVRAVEARVRSRAT